MNFKILSLTNLIFSAILATNLSAHVILDYPDGGENFNNGDVVPIQWHVAINHGPADWDLYFSSNGGVTWEPIVTNLPENQLTYEWTVPNIETNSGQVKVVQDNNVGRDYEDSSGVFIISNPTGTNVTFLSNLNQYSSAGYNDIWGYVDGSGIEYALLGCGIGTSIVRVDNPAQPLEVAFIPAPSSSWRDIKTHGTYAYIVTEGTGSGRGLQIVDLSQLPDTATLVNTIDTWFTRAHNIFIDNGYAYVIGTNGGGGMHILDLSNPTSPTEDSYYTGSAYIHDIYVWNDTVVACAEDTYDLVDVSNKSNPQFISSSLALPGIYAHSGWMTEDKRYFIACEEFNVRDITVWDLIDRSTWDLVVSSWQLPTGSSIVHNLFVKGNFAHISYYTSGYVVLDISDPTNPQIAGQYDTYPQNDGGTYNGAWGCYPYLPSGNTLMSDISTGLYVLHFDGEVTTFPLTASVADGWNMVSVPGLHPVNQNVDTWWSGKDPAAEVFKYTGGYSPVTTTTPTEGYWMKNVGAQVYSYPAIEIVTHTDISAASGWNMIGGYENTVPVGALFTTPPGLITGTIFEYSGGYVPATDIVPGYGYWVKMSAAGLIGGLGAPPLGKVSNPVAEYFQEDWGKIIITDNAGISYTLYAVKGEVDLNQYELPPTPPSGMFDIRYSSGRIAEDIKSSIQTIEMNSLKYPVRLHVENMTITLQDESGKEINAELEPGEEITITNISINRLLINSGEIVAPIEYALEQNYPNPFNPNTTIRFAVPKESSVNLSIYNVLGELISTLVNEQKKPGYYMYEFDASNLASGVFIYRLQAGSFVETKKMVLMK